MVHITMNYHTRPQFFNLGDEAEEAITGSRTPRDTGDRGGVRVPCMEKEPHQPSVEALHGCLSVLQP